MGILKIRTNRLLVVVEWLLLLGGLGAITITEVYLPFVNIGLGLLIISFFIRCLRTRRLFPPTGLEFPLLIFLISAGWAAWLSYVPGIAWLQFIRILAAIVLFYAIADLGLNAATWVAIGFVLMVTVLALYWPTRHDFGTDAGKFPQITSFGLWLNAHMPAIPGPSIHQNVAAGTLAMAIPFGIGLMILGWRKVREKQSFSLILVLVASICTLVIVACLVLTSSRGAWLSLALAGGLAGLVWIQRLVFRSPIPKIIYWSAIVLLTIGMVSGLVLGGYLNRILSSIYDPAKSLADREQILAVTTPLIGDYIFTGSGLMTFPLVYSTYGTITSAPYEPHSHNTYLEVWLEQGVVGFIALAWGALMVATWAWRALERVEVPVLGWAGLAGVAVIAINGLFDVVFYVERTLPLIGLSLGFGYLAVRSESLSFLPSPPWRKYFTGIITLVILVLIASILFFPHLAAAWHANLGALIQTRIELSHYNPNQYKKLSLDTIRRSTDLHLAQAEFQQALEWDPTNRTALHRLSGIAMSLGEYNTALKFAGAAWQAGYRDARTRLLYGDALVAAGQVDNAAEILRSINSSTLAKDRLWERAYYRYWLNSAPDYKRAAAAWETILLLDPNDKGAAYFLKEAIKYSQQTQP